MMRERAIVCGRPFNAPPWVYYALEGHSIPVARLLAARDAVEARWRRWRR